MAPDARPRPLSGSARPEAEAAAAVWLDAESRLPEVLQCCVSGREQSQRGWAADL